MTPGLWPLGRKARAVGEPGGTSVPMSPPGIRWLGGVLEIEREEAEMWHA